MLPGIWYAWFSTKYLVYIKSLALGFLYQAALGAWFSLPSSAWCLVFFTKRAWCLVPSSAWIWCYTKQRLVLGLVPSSAWCLVPSSAWIWFYTKQRLVLGTKRLVLGLVPRSAWIWCYTKQRLVLGYCTKQRLVLGFSYQETLGAWFPTKQRLVSAWWALGEILIYVLVHICDWPDILNIFPCNQTLLSSSREFRGLL